jgi:hypothetical protein
VILFPGGTLSMLHFIVIATGMVNLTAAKPIRHRISFG